MTTRELRDMTDRIADVGEFVNGLADRVVQKQLLRRRAARHRQHMLMRRALEDFECALEDAVHRSRHVRNDDAELQFACRDLHERLGSIRFRTTGHRTADRVVTFIGEAAELWRAELENAATPEELAESLTRAVDHVQDFLLGVEAILPTKVPATRDVKQIQLLTYDALIAAARKNTAVAVRDVRGWQEVERRSDPAATDEARSGAPFLFWPDMPGMA